MSGTSIEHSDGFAKQYDKLKVKHSDLVDAIAGVEWALCNDASVFPAVNGHDGYRLCLTKPGKSVPRLRVLAHVAKHKIELVAMDVVKED